MNKQIEEMARVLCDKCLEDGNPCDGAKHICVTERNRATTLYNAGYRNVHDFAKWHAEEQLKLSENVSKETAREILQKIIDFMEAWTNDQYLPDEIVENIEALEKNIKIGIKETYGVEVE